MNLYRIDTRDRHGYGTGAVSDLLGPVLTRSYRQARAMAITAAAGGRKGTERWAIITRIGPSGHLTQMGMVEPKGTVVRRYTEASS